MITITPSGRILGATIEGLELSRPLDDAALAQVTQALGAYGVLRFPRQRLDAAMLRDFSARFGELEVNVANAFPADGLPEVMILSNIVENGRPLGLADAGQDWHTDMSYSRTVAFANVLHAVRVPRRDGRALGATEFSNMHMAYDALPAELRTRLGGMTVLHDFEKFWEMMRRERGSAREEEQRPQLRAEGERGRALDIAYRRHRATSRNGTHFTQRKSTGRRRAAGSAPWQQDVLQRGVPRGGRSDGRGDPGRISQPVRASEC